MRISGPLAPRAIAVMSAMAVGLEKDRGSAGRCTNNGKMMPEEKNLAVAAAEGFPAIVSTGAVQIGKGAASAIAAGSVVAQGHSVTAGQARGRQGAQPRTSARCPMTGDTRRAC